MMCLAAISDYDLETQRQMCALEAMLADRRRKELAIDEGIRARANRFMPTASVEASPCVEAGAVGAYQEKAA
ncbi:hypothetical protein [Dyella mobilis]|uniref:Transposase n=1 Tax=Dyella mobilis TaxID=1849582 RepID=A0ABS2KKX9_9GAMM|nr:hypothetical protein [Dyella mobilis]MBM7131590.1 hypothetical protein [Dyella mobilis]